MVLIDFPFPALVRREMEKQILGEVDGDPPHRDGERHATKVTGLCFLRSVALCYRLVASGISVVSVSAGESSSQNHHESSLDIANNDIVIFYPCVLCICLPSLTLFDSSYCVGRHEMSTNIQQY